jgi:hypothetical protein
VLRADGVSRRAAIKITIAERGEPIGIALFDGAGERVFSQPLQTTSLL